MNIHLCIMGISWKVMRILRGDPRPEFWEEWWVGPGLVGSIGSKK